MKAWRVTPKTDSPEDRRAAEVATALIEAEWPKYEAAFIREVVPLFSRSVLTGEPIPDDELRAACKRIVASYNRSGA